MTPPPHSSGADDVEEEELALVHLGDAHDHRDKGPDDGDEAGQDQRLAAVLFEEGVGAFHVLALEQPGIGLVEDRRAGLGTDQVAGLVAHDGRHDDQRREGPDVELDGVRGDQEAGREQHGVAGQEEADQQARFREDDAADQQHNPGRQGRIGQEDLGVEPVGEERGQVRLHRARTPERGHGKVTHRMKVHPFKVLDLRRRPCPAAAA